VESINQISAMLNYIRYIIQYIFRNDNKKTGYKNTIEKLMYFASYHVLKI